MNHATLSTPPSTGFNFQIQRVTFDDPEKPVQIDTKVNVTAIGTKKGTTSYGRHENTITPAKENLNQIDYHCILDKSLARARQSSVNTH